MSKPKAPPESPASIELRRRQRTELDDLTREKNAQLKAIKQARVGARSLISSGRTTSPNQAGRDVQTGPPLQGLRRKLKGANIGSKRSFAGRAKGLIGTVRAGSA